MFAGRQVLARGIGLPLAVAFIASIIATAAPLSSSAAGAASQLTRYPYLTDLVADHVLINWATDRSGSAASVRYGPPGNCTANSATASRRSITVGSVAEYQWKASLSGLAPDTAYCYRIFLGATDLLGTDPSPIFRSQVAAGSSAPFSFAVFGDWGEVDANGANPDQANVMAQVASSGVRFAVTTGDTGYPGGTETTYGDLQQVGADTSAIFGPDFWARAGDSIPLFNATGNHGFNSVGLTNWPQDVAVATSSGRYQTDTYCCTNGTTSASYPSAWYAFDAGNARFYVLEAAWSSVNNGTASQYQNDYDNHWTTSSTEYQWLKQDLEAHPGGLKFAFWHYPMYSDNATETSSPFLQGTGSLEGLLASNHVSIGFNGHAHVYERNARPTGGIVTYLTGGGGAKLEPIGAKGCSAFDLYAIGWSYSANRGSACGSAPVPSSRSQVFHFLKVTVDGSTVTVAPTDSLGRTFDVKSYTFDTAGTETSLTFSATDDTYLQQSSPTTTKGSATVLEVDGSPVKDALLKFTVTGSAARSVTSAKLRLYVTDPSPSAGSVYGTVSSTWSESTANWSNAPPTSGAAVASIGSVSIGAWTEVDVTPAVSGDGTFSLRINSTSTNGANFASTEAGAATAPQLVVSYSGTSMPDTTPPSAPSGLSATAVSASRIDLRWTASTDDVGVTAYDIYRNGASTPLASVSGTATAFSDTTVTAATTYSYTVKARDAAGNVSPASAAASVTTPAAAATATFTPSGDTYVQQASPSATKGTSTRLETDGSPVKDALIKFDISGTAGRSVNSAKLRLYTTDPSPSGGAVYLTATSTWSEATANWSNAPATSGAAIASVGSVTTDTWAEVDVTPAVDGDGTLSLRISSTSTNGANYASKEGGAATAPQLVLTYSASGSGDTQPPTAPGNLAAAATSGSQVDLRWTASTDNVGVTAYQIYRNGGTTPLASVSGTATTYSDTSVSASTTYSYTVKARDAAGNVSAASNTASATTPAPAPVPPATPTGLQATAGDGSVALSWNASSGAASYNLKRGTAASGPFATIASPTGTTATDSSVTNGTTYYYVVSAVNSAGESANSSPVSATPQGASPPPSVTPVFSDDFESGNLSKWTSSAGLVAESSLVHAGAFAVRGDTTTGRTYAKKTLGSTYTDGYSRIWFYLASGYASQVNLLRYRAAADASLGYLYVTTSGKLSLRNDVAGISTASTTSVATDAWHALELHVAVNGTSSSTEVWLDGTKVAGLSLTAQNWGTAPIAAFQIGEVQTGRTYDVTFDDVAFATARIGP